MIDPAVVRFPTAKDFDIVDLDKCSRCGSAERLRIHHDVPIVFKWVPVYLEEILSGASGPSLFEVEAKLKHQYFSAENRSVICWKCQHGSFHTYTMCHYCDKYDSPPPYNACAICFHPSKRSMVRSNKLAEKERTIAAIRDVLSRIS